MASFYFDNDVSLRLASMLGVAGHDTTVALELGLAKATDEIQLLTASQRRQILLTHNRKDYLLLRDAWIHWPYAFGVVFPPHDGILVLDQRPDSEPAAAIGELFDRNRPEATTNSLYWWRYRVGWHVQSANRRWTPLP